MSGESEVSGNVWRSAADAATRPGLLPPGWSRQAACRPAPSRASQNKNVWGFEDAAVSTPDDWTPLVRERQITGLCDPLFAEPVNLRLHEIYASKVAQAASQV